MDYKIASEVIAKRLEKVLALLINPDQTGFIKGRYIGQNVRLINDILEETKIQNTAVSTKVVQKKRKSVRDKTER